jgi:hypothetical protein
VEARGQAAKREQAAAQPGSKVAGQPEFKVVVEEEREYRLLQRGLTPAPELERTVVRESVRHHVHVLIVARESELFLAWIAARESAVADEWTVGWTAAHAPMRKPERTGVAAAANETGMDVAVIGMMTMTSICSSAREVGA